MITEQALSEGLTALRERLDAELRSMHGRIGDIETALATARARLTELEGRVYDQPKRTGQSKKGSPG
jgi:hypothetical protein